MAVDAAEFAEEGDAPLRRWSSPRSQQTRRNLGQAARNAGSGAQTIGRVSAAGAGQGWSALPGGGITRLIWAVAIGLIALEVVSEATGTYWNFRLPGLGTGWQKKPYQPLYQGQALGNPQGAPSPGTGAPAGALPGIFGGPAGSQVVSGWHSSTLAGGV